MNLPLKLAAVVWTALGCLSLAATDAQAEKDRIVYSFNGTDGGEPEGEGVIYDGATDAFYGGTRQGGSNNLGVIYKLAADGTETVLHSFLGDKDGQYPDGDLMLDESSGKFFGVADGGSHSDGVVFALAPDGTYTALYNFAGATDGVGPSGGLVEDKQGYLYGVTIGGGSDSNYGTVYRLTQGGAEKVLYRFGGGPDGYSPRGQLTISSGTLYGMTIAGGQCSLCGTIFRMTTKGKKTTLYSFAGGYDGASPYGRLVQDKEGNLYGTTVLGGGFGVGTVFAIDPFGIEKVLYSFSGHSDGGNPIGLLMGSLGTLYGVTTEGGDPNCNCGTTFEVGPDGDLTTLHRFTGSDGKGDGVLPHGLLLEHKRHLYGVTSGGGDFLYGTVFAIKE